MERNANDTTKRWKRISYPLRAGIPVLLCGVVVLLASTPSGFDPADALEASARSRAVFGFRADAASHEAALASESADASLEKYGMALTREELVELDRRQDLALRMDPVAGALRDEAPDSFAAMYLDHEDNGTVVVLATHPDEIDSGKVADLVDGAPFRIQRVDRTAQQLRTDLESVREKAAQIVASGEGGLVGLQLDEEDNTIRVLVEDPAAERRIAAAFAGLGTPAYVEFAEEQIAPTTAVRGGDQIGASDGSFCSAGPQVWRDTAYGRFLYTLTAKHCKNGQYHKTAGHECATHSLRHDAAAQPHTTPLGLHILADVQLHWAGSTLGTINHYGTSLPVVDESHLYGWGYANTPGMLVCKRGRTTGTTCGYLESGVHFFNWYDVSGIGSWVNEQRSVAGMQSDFGDSGGVVYTTAANAGGATILGGQVACRTNASGNCATSNPTSYFSHIWFMHQELDEEGYSFGVQRSWE